MFLNEILKLFKNYCQLRFNFPLQHFVDHMTPFEMVYEISSIIAGRYMLIKRDRISRGVTYWLSQVVPLKKGVSSGVLPPEGCRSRWYFICYQQPLGVPRKESIPWRIYIWPEMWSKRLICFAVTGYISKAIRHVYYGSVSIFLTEAPMQSSLCPAITYCRPRTNKAPARTLSYQKWLNPGKRYRLLLN